MMELNFREFISEDMWNSKGKEPSYNIGKRILEPGSLNQKSAAWPNVQFGKAGGAIPAPGGNAGASVPIGGPPVNLGKLF